MSNSNRFLKGSVALLIWVSGVILVLGGCATRPGPDTNERWRKVSDSYSACLKRATESQARFEKYVWEHTYEWANTRKPTPKEEFTLGMLKDEAQHGSERCEANWQSDTQMLREMDREIDSLRPRTLYVVP